MDGARLSPYPHHAWLAHWIAIRPPRVFAVQHERHVTHRLLLTTVGDARIAWTTHDHEVLFESTVGDLGFYPCDQATHGLAITAAASYRAYAVLLPDRHLRQICETDEMPPLHGFRALPVFRDAVVRACLLRLAAGDGHMSEAVGDEIAARQIIIRLCAMAGGMTPDWARDRSVFTPGVMRRIVECVDAHLAVPMPLDQLSRDFGLSPSHFARKFRTSAGLSLNRFINRRRIGMSLGLLSSTDRSLAQLSFDLGFCSQSHFTRLFSALTGFSPHRFRRTHGPRTE
jgi:AraC-like DNA-binding protein